MDILGILWISMSPFYSLYAPHYARDLASGRRESHVRECAGRETEAFRKLNPFTD